MSEETAVFDGDHRIDHDFRDIGILHQAALRATLAFKKCGH